MVLFAGGGVLYSTPLAGAALLAHGADCMCAGDIATSPNIVITDRDTLPARLVSDELRARHERNEVLPNDVLPRHRPTRAPSGRVSASSSELSPECC